jgi:hypothetical protein
MFLARLLFKFLALVIVLCAFVMAWIDHLAGGLGLDDEGNIIEDMDGEHPADSPEGDGFVHKVVTFFDGSGAERGYLYVNGNAEMHFSGDTSKCAETFFEAIEPSLREMFAYAYNRGRRSAIDEEVCVN